jgi:branched-chain amino acid transport system ATP-binding protein
MTELNGSPLLAARDISAGYNALPVVERCNLVIHTGQVVLLMGRNGVGKTTLVSAISGRLSLYDGQLEFDGHRIEKMPAYRRSRMGIAHVPQGREVIPHMSVRENLLLAATAGTLESEDGAYLFRLFPRLHERLEQRAGTLSGGEQQMLAIGRAMLSKCRLMILDEPSLGLAPLLTEELFHHIAELVATLNMTVLLVEQQVSWIWKTGIADYVYVLDNGTISLEGRAGEIDLKAIESAYLGV